MEDIIEFRRKTSASGRWIGRKNPHIKIEMPRGTFVIFKKVANLLGAVDGDAIMFSFSRKDNCAYIYKEDPEEDSYYLCNSGREYYMQERDDSKKREKKTSSVSISLNSYV